MRFFIAPQAERQFCASPFVCFASVRAKSACRVAPGFGFHDAHLDGSYFCYVLGFAVATTPSNTSVLFDI